MFARVNENKNLLNKQFSPDGNWLCVYAWFGKLDIQLRFLLKEETKPYHENRFHPVKTVCITYSHLILTNT